MDYYHVHSNPDRDTIEELLTKKEATKIVARRLGISITDALAKVEGLGEDDCIVLPETRELFESHIVAVLPYYED